MWMIYAMTWLCLGPTICSGTTGAMRYETTDMRPYRTERECFIVATMMNYGDPDEHAHCVLQK